MDDQGRRRTTCSWLSARLTRPALEQRHLLLSLSDSTDEETRENPGGRALSSPISEGQQSNDKTFHFVFLHFTVCRRIQIPVSKKIRMTKIYHHNTLKRLDNHTRTVLKGWVNRNRPALISLIWPSNPSHPDFFQSCLGQLIDRKGSKPENCRRVPSVVPRQLKSPTCLKIIDSRLSAPLTLDFLVGESRLNRRLTV